MNTIQFFETNLSSSSKLNYSHFLTNFFYYPIHTRMFEDISKQSIAAKFGQRIWTQREELFKNTWLINFFFLRILNTIHHVLFRAGKFQESLGVGVWWENNSVFRGKLKLQFRLSIYWVTRERGWNFINCNMRIMSQVSISLWNENCDI